MTAAATTLGCAVREIAALYNACPEPRPPLEGLRWRRLERDVDAAITAGAHRRALASIAAWRRYAAQLVEIFGQLGLAVREVNAVYASIPEHARPDPASCVGLDREVDAAIEAGDRDRALAAIRAWRGHWLSAMHHHLPPTTREPTHDAATPNPRVGDG